jgi:hypothetical protein
MAASHGRSTGLDQVLAWVSWRSPRVDRGQELSADGVKEPSMTSNEETGEVTGTKDRLYNLIWFTEQSLSNALRLETFIQDAERDGDAEVADLFRRAQAESRKGGELGKSLLHDRLH